PAGAATGASRLHLQPPAECAVHRTVSGEAIRSSARPDRSSSIRRGYQVPCSTGSIFQYQARLSGPLLDRIDLHVEVPGIAAADLMLPSPAEGSLEVARRVAAARERQVSRYAKMGLPGLTSNAAPATVIESMALLDRSALV